MEIGIQGTTMKLDLLLIGLGSSAMELSLGCSAMELGHLEISYGALPSGDRSRGV